MRHSSKLWTDWLMNKMMTITGSRPRGQSIHLRYEKAGLTLYDPTIPWNADAIAIEAIFGFLPVQGRQKNEFTIRIPGRDPIPAEILRKEENQERMYRAVFRMPMVPVSTRAELLWRQKLMSEIQINVLSQEEFLSGLRLLHPNLMVRIGEHSVAAQSFVANQCRGLTAATLLQSPTSLAPICDLGLRFVLRNERTGVVTESPITLSSTQLASKETLVTASPSRYPKQAGQYTASWMLRDRELATLRATAVSGSRFLQSLRVSDTRFLLGNKGGMIRMSRNPPGGAMDVHRVGPCFFVCSREQGMAGLVTLKWQTQRSDEVAPMIREQAILVTDGPTAFAPDLIPLSELGGVHGFELVHNSKTLCVLSMNPVPIAVYNSEGGFKPPPDFTWTPTADEELSERLFKLMKDDTK